MTLTEFLLARIAEDEAGATERTWTSDHEPARFGEVTFARGRIYTGSGLSDRDVTDEYHAWRESLPLSDRSRRTLAEVEAKRRILGQVIDLDQHDGYTEATRDAVKHLAGVYASHPDCREEWRA